MPLLLSLPDEYSYVLAAATSTLFVNALHSIRTGKFRKASGIKYPESYASAEQAAKDPLALKFNCAQRAHANFTETHTSFLVALAVAGLRFPVASAALGGVWTVGRAAYLYGYTSAAGPAGRLRGGIPSSLAHYSLTLTAAYTAVMLVLNQ